MLQKNWTCPCFACLSTIRPTCVPIHLYDFLILVPNIQKKLMKIKTFLTLQFLRLLEKCREWPLKILNEFLSIFYMQWFRILIASQAIWVNKKSEQYTTQASWMNVRKRFKIHYTALMQQKCWKEKKLLRFFFRDGSLSMGLKEEKNMFSYSNAGLFLMSSHTIKCHPLLLRNFEFMHTHRNEHSWLHAK